MTALGRAWHPEHFVCGGCSTALGGSSFFEKDGAPFCPECYFERFSPRCGLCNQPIRHVSPAWTISPASVSPEELHPLRHFPSPSQPLPAFSSSSLRTLRSLIPKFLLGSPAASSHTSSHSFIGSGWKGRGNGRGGTLSVPFHSPQKMVTALGTHWHPEHFCCVSCGEPFGDEGESLTPILKVAGPLEIQPRSLWARPLGLPKSSGA